MIRKLIRSFFRSFTLLLLPLFCNCLITTQSYNHGKLLNPGERMMTHGFGWRYSSRYLPQERFVDSPDGFLLQDVRDSTRFGWFSYTFDYRVGLLRKYPLGKGVETGFHLETVSRSNKYVDWDGYQRTNLEFYGPPVLEIDTRFGLPDITMRKSVFHHNVNTGWIVGYWVDNGWFLGYAAGWELKHFIPYISARGFLSATYVINRPIDEEFFNKHDRKWGGRFTGGVSWRLPFNFSMIPEFITPEASLTFPNYSTGQHVGFNASLGIRWMLGQ